MTQQYDDTDRGALFKNDRKESDNHPDYKGNINVGGTDYWLSAWINTSGNGVKYMSLSVKPKDAPKPQVETYKGGVRQPVKRDDDDVPF